MKKGKKKEIRKKKGRNRSIIIVIENKLKKVDFLTSLLCVLEQAVYALVLQYNSNATVVITLSHGSSGHHYFGAPFPPISFIPFSLFVLHLTVIEINNHAQPPSHILAISTRGNEDNHSLFW